MMTAGKNSLGAFCIKLLYPMVLRDYIISKMRENTVQGFMRLPQPSQISLAPQIELRSEGHRLNRQYRQPDESQGLLNFPEIPHRVPVT